MRLIRVLPLVGSAVASLALLPAAASGASWSIQPTPNPTGGTNVYLYGVSCPASNACVGVGVYTNSTGRQVSLAERWNGTKWSLQSTPNPNGTQISLDHVSCSSTTACTAVGDYLTPAGTIANLVERWSGTSWSIEAAPNPGGPRETGFLDVSCASATSCTTAGGYSDQYGVVVTTAEQWDGASWTVQSTPGNHFGPIGSLFYGVSCSAVNACTSVGYTANSSQQIAPLVARWNGTDWSEQTVPVPTGERSGQLSGVSCASANACTSVGDYYNGAGADVSLAEQWNGSSWAVQATPKPAGATGGNLYGVSCIASSTCESVGLTLGSGGAYLNLAEVWNGTRWALQPTPEPSGASASSLEEVSCSAATACTAVGGYTTSGGQVVTLAERFS